MWQSGTLREVHADFLESSLDLLWILSVRLWKSIPTDPDNYCWSISGECRATQWGPPRQQTVNVSCVFTKEAKSALVLSSVGEFWSFPCLIFFSWEWGCGSHGSYVMTFQRGQQSRGMGLQYCVLLWSASSALWIEIQRETHKMFDWHLWSWISISKEKHMF